MAIYTKRGDKGETTLFSSKGSPKTVVTKGSLRICAIGEMDEANSYLGIILSSSEPEFRKIIEKIQEELFTIGSILAGANLRFYSTKTKYLEKQIDKMEEALPAVNHFILPGGTLTGSQLYYARALVRKAERVVIALNKKEEIKPEVIVYLNRLSDFLYILARTVNHDHDAKEKIWQGAK